MGSQRPDANTDSLPSRIAALVHTHFDGLPKRSKPIIRDDGTAEWIPMTGIVLVKGENTPSETLSCVAVATGAKCLPASQIPNCNGLVLHDCHAEILAMRAFNFWLLSECSAFFEREKVAFSHGGEGGIEDSNEAALSLSPYIRRRQILDKLTNSVTPPLEIQPDVSIYMYCTCAPCGDASMELLMAEQEDPTPWVVPNGIVNAEQQTLLSGRGHFSRLGIVRRKPARADAESTKSKSCSDKIALRQVTSLLNHEASLLVASTKSAYIKGLVMPEEEISSVGVKRCFGAEGRMKDLHGRKWLVPLDGDNKNDKNSPSSNAAIADQALYSYEFRPFEVLSIPNAQLASLWPFRKPKASDPVPEDSTTTPASQPKKAKPGTISVIWVQAPTVEIGHGSSSSSALTDNGIKNLPTLRGSKTGLFETLINGVKQGHRASAPGLRGASALSRARMYEVWKRAYVALSSEESKSATESKMTASEIPQAEEKLLKESSSGASEDREGETKETGAKDGEKVLTYRQFKKGWAPHGRNHRNAFAKVAQARSGVIEAAREVLGGWAPNEGDEDWGWNLAGLVDASGNEVCDAQGRPRAIAELKKKTKLEKQKRKLGVDSVCL